MSSEITGNLLALYGLAIGATDENHEVAHRLLLEWRVLVICGCTELIYFYQEDRMKKLIVATVACVLIAAPAIGADFIFNTSLR